MKIEIQSKPIQDEFVVLERGKRGFCHPSLKAIEQVDCVLTYNIPYKFFIVDYAREGILKTVISSRVDFIIEVLLEN